MKGLNLIYFFMSEGLLFLECGYITEVVQARAAASFLICYHCSSQYVSVVVIAFNRAWDSYISILHVAVHEFTLSVYSLKLERLKVFNY